MRKELLNGDLITTNLIPDIIKMKVLERAHDWQERARVYDRDELHTTQGMNETNCVGHATARMLGEMGVENAEPKALFERADMIDGLSGAGTSILAGGKAALDLHPRDVAGYVELGARAVGPWLHAIGPVICALAWYPGFQDARGGVMKPTGAREIRNGERITQHAVTILGYHPRRKTCLGHKPMFLINSATWSQQSQVAWLPEALLYRYIRGLAIGVYTPEQLIRD